jgi:hypothetical protein
MLVDTFRPIIYEIRGPSRDSHMMTVPEMSDWRASVRSLGAGFAVVLSCSRLNSSWPRSLTLALWPEVAVWAAVDTANYQHAASSNIGGVNAGSRIQRMKTRHSLPQIPERSVMPSRLSQIHHVRAVKRLSCLRRPVMSCDESLGKEMTPV